jgi:trehalose 6-phosphate synthase/phosphatase
MPNLVIVSNRLPVSVKKVDGKLEYSQSIGGLSMGLASYAADSGNKWIGWPGLPSDDLTEEDRAEISAKLLESNCYPLFLTRRQIDGFYNGYSNRFLWPLFHDVDITKSARSHEPDYWKIYREVNKLYTDKVLELSAPTSSIWVHDYQIMLVPEMLRARGSRNKIGFFLHIPFPAAQDFTQLKNGKRLVKGLLGADLIGFHIISYTNNFMDLVEVYGLGKRGANHVKLPDRTVRVTDFPIGIDYEKWNKAGRLPAVRKAYAELVRKYRGKKIIITADRLDPTKGYLERVSAYRSLLVRNPQLHGKVQLVLYAVPTRGEIEEYQKLKVTVERMVKEINQTYGTKRWLPVEYHYDSLAFAPLRALYQRADVAFVTPLRDGMNLTAKEYLASKSKGSGVLVLSETAGAAQELHEAVLVNPKDPASMVAGLERALTIPGRGFITRVINMQKVIEDSTIHNWAGGFMHTLRRPLIVPSISPTKILTARVQESLLKEYKTALKRVLLLDYDGVLAPIAPTPEAAKPSNALIQLLTQVASAPSTEVVVVSGRSRSNLEEWLGGLGLNFAAEHGAYTRRGADKRWERTPTTAAEGWQDKVLPILELYAARTPGAHVEQKSTALVWHYRQAKPYYAQKHLVILKRLLKPLATSLNLHVRQGKMILEVKAADINKGQVASQWVADQPDFVLAIGDDYTDEDMFAAVPDAYTIKVGSGETAARYRLKDSADVMALLKKLAS